jgi:hypothetical protein
MVEDDAQRGAALKAPIDDWLVDAWRRSLGARRQLAPLVE